VNAIWAVTDCYCPESEFRFHIHSFILDIYIAPLQ